MRKKILSALLAVAGMAMVAPTSGFSYSSYGSDVNSICSPTTPFTGDCTLCHASSSKATMTPAKDAYLAGGSTLRNYFCPAPSTPTCTDKDGDGYAIEGGACGAVDCNDNNPAIHPGAAEVCTDKLDNDCNGLIDTSDPTAVGCPAPCVDSDKDGYAVGGGTCGPVDCNDTNASINPGRVDIPNNGIDENCDGVDSVNVNTLDTDGDGFTPAAGDCNDKNAAIHPGAIDIPNNGIDENCDGGDSVDRTVIDNDGDGYTPATGDCNDTDAAIHPGAVENCTDGIDNNCNGLVDTKDQNAVNCPSACTDNDGDGYATEGGACGQVDCNDLDLTVNPAAVEICGDSADNNCDGQIDEGCSASCPDIDGDGYLDAACGGNDCDDTNAAINPGAEEICGNNIDNNCNGASDETCTTCPDGTVLLISKIAYDRGDRELTVAGNANIHTTVTVADASNTNGEILAAGIPVLDGKWSVDIHNLSQMPETIRATTAEGCFTDQSSQASGNHHEDGSRNKSYHRRSWDSETRHD